MIKCKKCGSSNVKVDFNKVYTSIPTKLIWNIIVRNVTN